MFWYLLGIISIITLIIGIIIYNLTDFEVLGFVMNMISSITLIVVIIIISIGTIIDKQEVNNFIQQKEYIENHTVNNDIEDAALTTKKIELNEWLYNAQFFKTNYGFFSLYPDKVLELEEIK